MLMMTDWRE